MGRPVRVHHIGYAVRDHDEAEAGFSRLGFTLGERTSDEGRNVCITFAQNGDYLVEIVSPLVTPGSPIDGILDKVGPTAYHICYATTDIVSALAELKPLGWRAFGVPMAAPAINYSRVVFAYHRSLEMLELVELANDEERGLP